MTDSKRQTIPACDADSLAPDRSRRDLAKALFGALGGTAALQGCAVTSVDGKPNEISSAQQTLMGTNVVWFEAVYPSASATLKGNTGTGNLVAIAEGYLAPGDGGGGVFGWSTTAAPDNGATVINPGGGTSAGWRRIYSGPIDLRWFGGRADWNGVTDSTSSGTDNAPAAQAALDYLHGIGGGELLVPDGKYLFRTGLKVHSYCQVVVSAGASVGITSAAGGSQFVRPTNHLGQTYAEGCLFNLVGEAYAQYFHTGSVITVAGRFYSDAESNLGLVHADAADAPVVRNVQLESRQLYSSAGYLLYDTYAQQCTIRFGRPTA